MSVIIHCPNQTLTYQTEAPSGIILLFPNDGEKANEHKSIYSALIVARLVYGILHDDPVLCTEFSCLRKSTTTTTASQTSIRSLQNYVGCIRELGFCDSQCTDNFPTAQKWIMDLLNLEQWVSEFKISIVSSFTKTNMAKSTTKVTVKFPFSAHVGGQLSPTSPTSFVEKCTTIKRKRKHDEDDEDDEQKVHTDEIANHNHIVIPQHAYQFVYRCFQDSLPGKKEISSVRDNQLFEFSFLKDKYSRRDQVETAVGEFVTKYQNCIGHQLDKDGECSLVWTIGGENTLVVFPALF